MSAEMRGVNIGRLRETQEDFCDHESNLNTERVERESRQERNMEGYNKDEERKSEDPQATPQGPPSHAFDKPRSTNDVHRLIDKVVLGEMTLGEGPGLLYLAQDTSQTTPAGLIKIGWTSQGWAQ